MPGDKSIAHRALLLVSLAEGSSELRGLPVGEDVAATLRAVETLGIEVKKTNPTGEDVKVAGAGLRGFRAPVSHIDCANSGTTLRLIAGLLAGQPFGSTLTGDLSLRRRPMQRIVEPLRAMGAELSMSRAGTAPLHIESARGSLRAITHRPAVASAQVKSCVLLAGMYADGVSVVEEPLRTRDHTERILAAMGVEVESAVTGRGCTVSVRPPPAALATISGTIPGDVSSAAYWLVAAALLPGSEVSLPGVGLNPTRSAIVDLLRDWGADIETTPEPAWQGEPVGTLLVRGADTSLRGGSIWADSVPALIDELPLLAALGPFTEEGVEIRGAAELRVKESDRVGATAAALRALGAEVDEYPDGMAVAGQQQLRGGTIDAAGDHRIALAFGAVGLATRGPVSIRGAEAMRVSYPGFETVVEELAER